MAAFAMAVLLNGMSRDEIRVMTDAMIASGERMSFAGLGKPTVDKHSTGGVGDKITLPLAPLVAAFGVAVPQLSGRGLGHTGGTLDKLESIPGLARRALERRAVRPAPRRRRRDLRRRLGARARRQEALRAARRHRHRRGDPAHRLEHHVEEDRRGHRLARARREVRLRRLHAATSTGRASSRARWSRSAPIRASRRRRSSPT